MKTFTSIADIDFPIIDADAHVNEPPDLWSSRVPAKWRARAPQLTHTDHGDVWSFDEGKRMWELGLTATAGLSYLQLKKNGFKYSEIRPASFDPKARLKELDIDGIHGQVLYPSVALTGAKTYADEPELQRACVRAYNEWIAEFCSGSDDRLVGQAIIPTTGVEDAIAEMQYAISLGLKGVIISMFPNGSFSPDPTDDAFWSLAEEAQIPVAIHIGSFLPSNPNQVWPDMSSVASMAISGLSRSGATSIPVAATLIFSLIFTKFPSLKVVLVESNMGWIPIFLEQMDDNFLRNRFHTGAVDLVDTMPSVTFNRNIWATFMIDTVGIEMRHRFNMEHVCWSTDYPHTTSDWPNSRRTIEHLFRGVEMPTVRMMLFDNAKNLYGIDSWRSQSESSVV